MGTTIKFNPFDRKTATLPTPVQILSTAVNTNSAGFTYFVIELLAANTNSGLSAVAKNYKPGSLIHVCSEPLIVIQVDCSIDPGYDNLGDLHVSVQAITPETLLKMAAGLPQSAPVEKAFKVITPPKAGRKILFV